MLSLGIMQMKMDNVKQNILAKITLFSHLILSKFNLRYFDNFSIY